MRFTIFTLMALSVTALAMPIESALEAKYPGELKAPKLPKVEGLKAPKLPKVEGLKLPKAPKPFVMARSEAAEFKEPGFLKEDKKLGKEFGKDAGKLGKEFKLPKEAKLPKAPKIPKGF